MAKTSKIDAVTFTGRSGQEYEFRVYAWANVFKPFPGVYLVASRSKEPDEPPRYHPLFIGMTPDLSKVFESHARNGCFKMYRANVVGALTEPDEAVRAWIVDDLIASLSPTCNSADAE